MAKKTSRRKSMPKMSPLDASAAQSVWDLMVGDEFSAEALPHITELARDARVEQIERIDILGVKASQFLTTSVAMLAGIAALLATDVGPKLSACALSGSSILLVLAAGASAYASGTRWFHPLDPASVIRQEYVADAGLVARAVVQHYVTSRLRNRDEADRLAKIVKLAKWLLMIGAGVLLAGGVRAVPA